MTNEGFDGKEEEELSLSSSSPPPSRQNFPLSLNSTQPHHKQIFTCFTSTLFLAVSANETTPLSRRKRPNPIF
jgi:hypothetical protein